MKAIIEEVNDKLKVIVNELLEQKQELEKNLDDVQEKIDNKIEEAKTYKLEVDSSKEEIERLESEIADLEQDLKDLNAKFGGKDLNAILDTADKEINLKISERQKEINKQKERINEFAEKAKTIKDLLINLKKDKESKRFKLNNLTETHTYYEKSINELIDFSINNVDNLNETLKEDETDAYHEEVVVDDKPIFDEIASIEDESKLDETDVQENEPVEIDENEINNAFDYDFINDNNDEYQDNLEKSEETSVIPENEVSNLDFKQLNDNIDKEYADIFGSSDEIRVPDEASESQFETGIENNYSSDLFGFNNENNINEDFLNSTEFKEEKSEASDVENFFKMNNIDFNKFNVEDQATLENNFNTINYTKTLDILRKNNIDLQFIYEAPNIFKVIHNELETIINKLLLAGQSTTNISYVLNAIPLINSFDLQDVIESYGSNIKDANITDLIIKAKHLKELGGK